MNCSWVGHWGHYVTMSDIQTPPDEQGISRSQMVWLMTGLSLGLFLSSTEQSVVATALPTMAGELGQSDRIAWVVSAYLITSTISTPIYGKMSDLFGRRLIYLTAIAMFSIGSILCGLAPTMNTLVVSRAVQGLGGGGLLSMSFVIVGDVVSPRERGRYIGLFTSVFTVAAISGPLWGGLLVDGPGWRWVFWTVVPLSAITFGVSAFALRLPFATRRRPIDWVGIALLIVASTALILVPIWGGQAYAWLSWPVLVAAIVGIVATILFVIQEGRAEEPVIPLHLFKDRTILAVFVMGAGIMGALLALSTFMPLFLQISTGASATRSGLIMVPQTVAISLTATISGFLVTRTGHYKWTLVAGPIVAVAGMVGLTGIGVGTTALSVGPVLFLLGCGLGLIFPNLTLSIQNTVDPQDLGIGTSTGNFFRSMGGAFGAAVGGSILASRLGSELTSRLGAERLADVGGARGLIRTPSAIQDLPVDLREAARESVAASVTHLIWLIVPVLVVVLVAGLFVRERPLRTTSNVGGDRSAPSS